jgi:hypothetical protein
MRTLARWATAATLALGLAGCGGGLREGMPGPDEVSPGAMEQMKRYQGGLTKKAVPGGVLKKVPPGSPP